MTTPEIQTYKVTERGRVRSYRAQLAASGIYQDGPTPAKARAALIAEALRYAADRRVRENTECFQCRKGRPCKELVRLLQLLRTGAA